MGLRFGCSTTSSRCRGSGSIRSIASAWSRSSGSTRPGSTRITWPSKTGANYFVCSFQWGDLTHEQAMRSIELFTRDVMARYVTPSPATRG